MSTDQDDRPARTGPTMNRGGSEQSVETDPRFIRVTVRRFGPINFDLAACASNHQVTCFPRANPRFPNGSVPQDAPIRPYHRDPYEDRVLLFAGEPARPFFTEEDDSLVQDWLGLFGREDQDLNAWLNPPFSNIRPWAAKCADWALRTPAHCRSRILLLTPASVGSEWFHKLVVPYADVLLLKGRLRFVGHENDYPKDLILSVFEAGVSDLPKSIEPWAWKDKLLFP